MRIVIQRVSRASVSIDGKIHNEIGQGLMVLVGITHEDNQEDIEWITKKLTNLRIFDDENGQMNLSLKECQGDILLVSQFTLHASTKKGNRPSYIQAAKPDIAIPIYEKLIDHLEQTIEKPIKTGIFGADMKVSLINNGPVTIIIDSKNKQ